MSGDATAGDDVWTFDDFAEGHRIGTTVSIPLDERRVALWRRIYGTAEQPDGDAVPASLPVTAMMEAYLKVIPSRPPGNVHASQKLQFLRRPVGSGVTLDFAFSCLAKTIKRERRWVTIGVTAADRDGLVLCGEITTIWAR